MIGGFVEVSAADDRASPIGRDEFRAVAKVKPSRRGMTLAILLALALAGASAWYATRGPDKVERAITAVAERGDIEEAVSAIGAVQPSQYVDVGTQVTGQLKSLKVKIGDQVKEGQLLAEIDPVVFEARVEASRATLDNLRAQLAERLAQQRLAEQQHERNRKLFEGDALSEEAYQVSVAERDRAAAQVGAIRAQIRQNESQLNADLANLRYTRIFAPMAGTVVSITSRQGQTLVASQQAPVIMRIADLKLMTVWAQVSEADVPHIREGMPVYFNTLGSRERRWQGRVRQILPTPETVNNVVLYNVLFDVDNPDLALKPQMSAQVYFVLDRAEGALIVPVAALEPTGGGAGKSPAGRQAGGEAAGGESAQGARNGLAEGKRKERKFRVRVLKDDQPEAREVTVGVMNRAFAQVIAGLSEGERVIAGTVPEARDNSRARTLPRPGRL